MAVDGEIPEVVLDADGNYVSGGLSILAEGLADTIAFNEEISGRSIDDAVLGSFLDFEADVYEIVLLENTGSVTNFIFNDVIEDADQDYTFTLVNDENGVLGSNYTVNPDTASATFTLTDGVVPTDDPTVGITVTETELLEGDEFTVNFTVDGNNLPTPENPLTVLVDSGVLGAIGEFVIFDEDGNPAVEFEGIAGFPEVNGGSASGFLVDIIDSSASLTLSVFEDGPGEGLESFDFSVINGEVYEVDPENAGVTLTIDDTPQTVDEVVFDFEWTGQIARFNVTGQFSYDQNQTYTDGIVREEDLLGFDISFFAPDGTLLRTYEDNHLTFPEFNFAYDTNTGEILQDGAFMGEEGFNVGEKTPVGDGTFTGLSFFSRPELNPQGEVPPPHLHIDDWSDEFGFPLGFSTHEDVAFFTRTTQQLLDTGRMGEAYIDDVQDSLDEFGERIQVSFVDDSFIPVFGSLGGDTIEVDGGNQLVFGGAEDDLIDASLTSETGNRIYGQSGDDTLILGTGDRALGGDGDDRFFVLSDGDNLITGGAGMDQFWIATAEIPEEINTITDFTSGEDVIGLAGLGIGFADLSITQQDADTLIALGNDELAKLLGINAGSLSAADFAFAASL